MVLLVTSDNEQFIVDKDVAKHIGLLSTMSEGECTAPRCFRLSYV